MYYDGSCCKKLPSGPGCAHVFLESHSHRIYLKLKVVVNQLTFITDFPSKEIILCWCIIILFFLKAFGYVPLGERLYSELGVSSLASNYFLLLEKLLTVCFL